MSAAPLLSFVDAGDASCGITVLVDGLNEYEVTEEETPRVALTLLRCVGWLSREDLSTRQGNAGPTLATPGAQCLGRRSFRFAALPRAEAPSEGSLYAAARAFLSPPRLAGPAGREGRLSLEHSFLGASSDGAFVASAIKRCDDRDSIVVRLFNPGSAPSTVMLRASDLRESHLLDLRERRRAVQETDGETVRVELRAHGIETVELLGASARRETTSVRPSRVSD